MLAMVGIAMNASINEALNKFIPVSKLNFSCIKGATTTIPKNPIITDGIEAIISITGFIISLAVDPAISERYIAIERLKGMAIIDAINVTESDALIRGKIPKRGLSLVGYHSLPNKKFETLTVLKTGKPSLNKNIIIRKRTNMEVTPITRKNFPAIISRRVALCIFIFMIQI
jgi:hypothetical protein